MSHKNRPHKRHMWGDACQEMCIDGHMPFISLPPAFIGASRILRRNVICSPGTVRAGHILGEHMGNWQHAYMYPGFIVSGKGEFQHDPTRDINSHHKDINSHRGPETFTGLYGSTITVKKCLTVKSLLTPDCCVPMQPQALSTLSTWGSSFPVG